MSGLITGVPVVVETVIVVVSLMIVLLFVRITSS